MNSGENILIFGVKSPLVVDYEETFLRLKIHVAAAVSMGGSNRMLAREKACAYADALGQFNNIPFIPCAFSPRNRRSLRDDALQMGLILSKVIIDPTSVIASSTKVGRGSYINAGVVMGGATIIDQCCVINRNASVGHHCFLSEFVSVGPGAVLSSNVKIGKNAVIGAGATILPDVQIGENAVVSAGSVVRRHVKANTLVSGNPARVSRLKPERSQLRRNDQE